ncbi:MAG: hypothetical protein DDT40_01292 [candidate division WS2 bacterium]|nr:hypothetical protein [Candidatus Psychracetigena formicireducens]
MKKKRIPDTVTYSSSRRTDTTLIQCEHCNWKGMVMDCIHSYAAVPPDDVEPEDYCPLCGNSSFI